jgi:Tfp pilus assembly protein PilO
MSSQKSFSLKEPRFVIDAKEAYKRYKVKEEFWRNAEILATLLTICLLLVFAVRPAVVVVSGLLSEIKSKKIIFSKMRSKVGGVVEAQEKFSQLQGKKYLLDRFYPVSPQLAWGTAQLIGLVFDANLDFSSISLGKLDMINFSAAVGNKKSTSGINFSLSAKGYYPDISRFISSLNELARWVEIDNYSITAPKDEASVKDKADSDKLTLSVSGRLMFFSTDGVDKGGNKEKAK